MEFKNSTTELLTLKGCTSHYTSTLSQHGNQLWGWGGMVGKGRPHHIPVTKLSRREVPTFRRWCSFPCEHTGIALCQFTETWESDRAAASVAVEDSGQVNRGPRCCHGSHSPSHTPLPTAWHTLFPPSSLLPHKPSQSITRGNHHSLSKADNCDETYFLSLMEREVHKTWILHSMLPLTHWDIWGLGKVVYLCRHVLSSFK